MSEKLLTLEEVAKYLNVSEGAVKELVQKRELPAYRIGGAFLRFKREQIEIYSKKLSSEDMTREALFNDRGLKRDLRKKTYRKDLLDPDKVAPYTFWERLEDFLYYNDFYILSLILLVLIVLAVFEF